MGSVKVQDHNFPAGTKVGLYERIGDARGELVDEQTSDERGEVEFTGLEVGAPFYLKAEDSDVHVSTAAQDPSSQPGPSQDPNPAEESGREVVHGARSTASRRQAQGRQPKQDVQPSSEAVSKADAHSFGGNDTEVRVAEDDGSEVRATNPSPTDAEAGKKAREQGAQSNRAEKEQRSRRKPS